MKTNMTGLVSHFYFSFQSAMLNLLLTVSSTLFSSVPLVLVIFIFLICYTLLGVIFFSNVRSGEAIDYK